MSRSPKAKASAARSRKPRPGGATSGLADAPHSAAAATGESTRFVAEASQLYHVDPQARIALIREGVPASSIGELSMQMGISKENLLASLGLSRATINRKERNATPLSRDESERVLGVGMLIGMVQTMVQQSGDPAGFDAARWVAGWLASPVPALAGATPASYMDTIEGQRLVAELLARTQSGVYA